MERPARIRRPRLERTEPLRGGAGSLFAPPPEDAPARPGDASAAPPSSADPLARAVDLGYRVVDDYMRQGQNAARRLARRSYGPTAFANDLQEISARWMHYGAELLEVWMGVLGQSGGNAGSGPASGTASGGPAAPSMPASGAATGATASARLAVALESPGGAAEVRADLDAAAGSGLVVQPLQAPGGAPAIEGATIEAGALPCLRVRVPAGQPPGTYSGLVVDAATNLPAGTVVLRVLPRAGGDAPS